MTGTQVFAGTGLADEMLARIRKRVGDQTVTCRLVRDEQSGAAMAYATRLGEGAARAGITVTGMSYAQVPDLLAEESKDPVIFLHPAPPDVDVAALIQTFGAARDAEGLHPLNAGKLALGIPHIAPPTARAAMLVAHHLVGPLSGKRIAIVGASVIVGLPLAQLLIHAGATVRVAQASTEDLAAETRDAEVVISATGVPGLIVADHIRQGACVIDVGVTRVAGALVGDVDLAAVAGKAAVVSHVPDGVGPLTAACLFENVVTLHEAAALDSST